MLTPRFTSPHRCKSPRTKNRNLTPSLGLFWALQVFFFFFSVLCGHCFFFINAQTNTEASLGSELGGKLFLLVQETPLHSRVDINHVTSDVACQLLTREEHDSWRGSGERVNEGQSRKQVKEHRYRWQCLPAQRPSSVASWRAPGRGD